MKGSPRTYVLTEQGERYVALMRLGVISQTGPIATGQGRNWSGPGECRGVGQQAVARG